MDARNEYVAHCPKSTERCSPSVAMPFPTRDANDMIGPAAAFLAFHRKRAAGQIARELQP